MTRGRREEDPGPGEDVAGKSISEAIDTYLQKRGMAGVSLLAGVCSAWPEVVGQDVAVHARPVRVDGPILVVEVDHAAWATQLAFSSERILERLAAALGKPVATSLEAHVRAGRRLE